MSPALALVQPRQSGKSDGQRRAMLAKVHIARKELRLDDATYGEVLARVTGVESAKTLTLAQLDVVLREFKRLGWKGAPGPARPLSQKASVRMVYAIWKDLRPHLRDNSDEALRSFVRRQTKSRQHPEGVAAPEFLDSRQCNLVLEGMKAWRTRVLAEAARAALEAGHGG